MSAKPRAELAAEFGDRWLGVGGSLWWVDDLARLPGVLARAARDLAGDEADPTVVVASEPPELPGFDWQAVWPPPDWQYHSAGGRADASGADAQVRREQWRNWARAARLGVTGAAWAVAETGSVALYGGTAALLPSLLPPAHLMIVHERQVVPTVQAGLARLRVFSDRRGKPPPMVKIVTGPSSTADIEGQLWIGVHGPARVGVVLLAGAVPWAEARPDSVGLSPSR